MAAPRPPSPPPARHNRDTEIDIYTSRNQTEVDVHRHGRGRSVSRERTSRRALQTWDDDVVVQSDRRQLQVDIEHRRSTSRGRRAHSAAPPAIDYDDEAYEITRKIDSRGRMGEAWNGITKDWSIIDVPPGTERVRLDGAGGASAEVTWQKYSGVRRTKFIPERDDKSSAVSSSTSLSELRAPAERERRLSVHVVDNDRGVSRERNVDVEKVTDRRITVRGSTSPPRNRSETWTEITKDLVCREAIEQLNYEYEETDYFYYIVEYLSYVSNSLPSLESLPRFFALLVPRTTQTANTHGKGGRRPPREPVGPHPRRPEGARPRDCLRARMARRLGSSQPSPPPPPPLFGRVRGRPRRRARDHLRDPPSGERVSSLRRFVTHYQTFAQLTQPTKVPVLI